MFSLCLLLTSLIPALFEYHIHYRVYPERELIAQPEHAQSQPVHGTVKNVGKGQEYKQDYSQLKLISVDFSAYPFRQEIREYLLTVQRTYGYQIKYSQGDIKEYDIIDEFLNLHSPNNKLLPSASLWHRSYSYNKHLLGIYKL